MFEPENISPWIDENNKINAYSRSTSIRAEIVGVEATVDEATTLSAKRIKTRSLTISGNKRYLIYMIE